MSKKEMALKDEDFTSIREFIEARPTALNE